MMVFFCRWEKIIVIQFLLMLAVNFVQAQEKSARICINQLGYASEQQKMALLASPEPIDNPVFTLVDSLGNTVYTGQGTTWGLLWGTRYYELDFSRFDKAGRFHVVSSENASKEFVIRKNPWALIDLKTILDQFYESVICSGACSKGEKGLTRHQEDIALPVNRIPLNGQEEIISGEFSGDCSGGYHSSNLLDKETYYNAYSLLILATHFSQEKLWIPVIDRYAEQLLKMQHEDGSFAYGIMASNARFPRRIIDNAFPDATSLGVAALAASVPALKRISQDRADRSLKAAEKGIQWLEDHLRNYEKPLDHAYFPLQANAIWAFVEMYRLTGEGKYMRKVLLLFKELKVEDLLFYVSKPNPTIFSLTRILPFLDKAKQDEMKLFFDRWVDIQRKIFHQSPFGINLRYFQDQKNTSLLLLNNSFDLLAVSQVNQDQEIARLAIKQLCWIFGLNPYLVSLVNGVGQPEISEEGASAYGTVITGPFGGSDNLALLKPATAFSVQDDGDYGPSNAVDGSMATRWSSDFFEPQWLQIDLGKVFTLEHIIIDWEFAYANEYQILVSEDDQSWQEVFSTSHGNGNEDEIVFKPVSARYIRIICGKRAGVWGFSIFEIEVYGGRGPIYHDQQPDIALINHGSYSLSTALLAAVTCIFQREEKLSTTTFAFVIALPLILFVVAGLSIKVYYRKAKRPEPDESAVENIIQASSSEDKLYNFEEAFQSALKTRFHRPIHKELSCLLGKSDALLTLLEQITRIADSEATVFISGEVGSGKGLVAQSIHQISHRREANFVEVNCAAIPESLLESELFGIEKGVATGVEKRLGKFEHAHQGTLFLDEIADTTLLNQAKLLKAIQEKQIIRVGTHTPVQVDVRILTATNQNLKKLAQEGLFRQDLLSRINVINLPVPALRERTEDIPVLIYYSLKQKNRLDVQFTVEAVKTLRKYRWPHNVRELQNEIEQIISFAQNGKVIGLKDLAPHLLSNTTAEQESALEQLLAEEDLALLQQLRSHDFNLSKAAHALSKSRDTIDQHMKGIVFAILDACDIQIKEACLLIGAEDRHLRRIESKVRLYLDTLGKHINKYGKKRTDAILKVYRKVPSRFYPHIESIIQKIISSF